MRHVYWITCPCELCREETRLREESGDKVLAWLRANGPSGIPPSLHHKFSRDCGCRACLLEMTAQRIIWHEAIDRCARHGGDGASACELCVDQICGADDE